VRTPNGLVLKIGVKAFSEILVLTGIAAIEHPDTMNTMINQAICYRVQGKYADAEAIYLKVMLGAIREMCSCCKRGLRRLNLTWRTAILGWRNATAKPGLIS
jgi:hypothetical protein